MRLIFKKLFEEFCSHENLYKDADSSLLNYLLFRKNRSAWKINFDQHLDSLLKKLNTLNCHYSISLVNKIHDLKELIIKTISITYMELNHAFRSVIKFFFGFKYIIHYFACSIETEKQKVNLTNRDLLRMNDCSIKLDIRNFIDRIQILIFEDFINRGLQDEKNQCFLKEIINFSAYHKIAGKAKTAYRNFNLFDESVFNKTPLITKLEQTISIGNHTIIFFFNWYRNELDQFIEHSFNHTLDVCYSNNNMLYSYNRKHIISFNRVIPFLCRCRLNLILHEIGQHCLSQHGISFAGFHFLLSHFHFKITTVMRLRRKFYTYLIEILYHTYYDFNNLYRCINERSVYYSHEPRNIYK